MFITGNNMIYPDISFYVNLKTYIASIKIYGYSKNILCTSWNMRVALSWETSFKINQSMFMQITSLACNFANYLTNYAIIF